MPRLIVRLNWLGSSSFSFSAWTRAAEQERVYDKVSREAKALKKNLEHVQREREDDQKKKEIEISLRRVGAIRYRALGSR